MARRGLKEKKNAKQAKIDNFVEAQNKYLTDPEFRKFTDCLLSFFIKHNWEIKDLRQAHGIAITQYKVYLLREGKGYENE